MARSAWVLFIFMIMVCRSCCVSPTSSHHHHPDDELHTHYYTQTIDHFTYLPQSYLTFPQRYLISSKHWGGDGFPILVYLGGEDGVAPAFIEKSVGFLAEHAPHLKAMKVYIEVCTEQMNPIWYYGNNTMFPASSSRSDVDKFRATLCQNKVGVSPRPHWLSTEFGGTEIKRALKMFASNIIFYNGLQDPWSTGGVLKSISNTLVALTTPHGAHCADLNPKSPNDPAWLVNLRQKEIKIVKGWLKQYGRNV